MHVEDGNGCPSDFGAFTVSNPTSPDAPTLSVDNDAPCFDGSAQITITNVDGAATYSWTGPNGYTTTGTSVTINNIYAINVGNYCVTSTIAGCVSQPACQAIAISPNPNVDVTIGNNDPTICLREDLSLTATGAASPVL